MVVVFVMAVVTAWGGAFYVSAQGVASDSGGSSGYEPCEENVGFPDIDGKGFGCVCCCPSGQFICQDTVLHVARKNADAVCQHLFYTRRDLQQITMDGICFCKDILASFVCKCRGCHSCIQYNERYQSTAGILLSCNRYKQQRQPLWSLLPVSVGRRASDVARHINLTIGKEVRHV